MNRDDITYSIPTHENEADRYAMDDSPVRLGETGAGLGLVDTPETERAHAESLGLGNVNAWRRNKGLPEFTVAEFLDHS